MILLLATISSILIIGFGIFVLKLMRDTKIQVLLNQIQDIKYNTESLMFKSMIERRDREIENLHIELASRNAVILVTECSLELKEKQLKEVQKWVRTKDKKTGKFI